MIDEQIFENTLLGLLDDGRLGVDDHPIVDHCRAGRNQQLAARSFDLDQTHPAQTGGVHPRVPTETGNVIAVVFGNLDQDLARRTLHLDAVNGDGDKLSVSQVTPSR
jgi:hypothetical protein